MFMTPFKKLAFLHDTLDCNEASFTGSSRIGRRGPVVATLVIISSNKSRNDAKEAKNETHRTDQTQTALLSYNQRSEEEAFENSPVVYPPGAATEAKAARSVIAACRASSHNSTCAVTWKILRPSARHPRRRPRWARRAHAGPRGV